MCHRKEPIGAMQIVQKDISENLHIRDVGLYAVKLGREDSDAPPQGGFSHAGDLKSQSGRTPSQFSSFQGSKPIQSCKLHLYCDSFVCFNISTIPINSGIKYLFVFSIIKTDFMADKIHLTLYFGQVLLIEASARSGLLSSCHQVVCAGQDLGIS